MDLSCDEDGFIYYQQLLYFALRRMSFKESKKKNIFVSEAETNTLRKIKQSIYKEKNKNLQNQSTSRNIQFVPDKRGLFNEP